uniref:MKS transition zone complex subunit 1 n=1 Tax=Esox lucius TaxID=8010 RepID=A0A6Q2X4P1_ESOLU
MADGWNTDTGEAVYRSRDAVKNLKIKIHIQRVTSTAALSQHLQQQVLAQQERDVIELNTLNSQAQSVFFSLIDEEQSVLKCNGNPCVCAQYEVDLFQSESVCQTPLERQYHTEIMALERTRGRPNRRIFTYTDFDRYTNWEGHAQSLVTQAKSNPTFLAERMANVRHRRQDRRPVDSSIPKSRLINWEPSEDFVKTSHVVNTPVMTMHIMGDLGPQGKLGQKEKECLLCTIRADGNGVVTIKPDFNKGKEPYRVETDGEKREVWRLTLENVSANIRPEEKEQEQRMYKDSPVITLVPCNNISLSPFPESAKGFEYDNLYVHFFMELPKSESKPTTLRLCNWVLNSNYLPQWPVVYFKVLSLDFWQRYRTEGYGYLVIPSTPGKHTVSCHTWRPLQTGTVSELRRFFIGGSPELEDYSYVRVPGTFKGDRLSRFGFRTLTSGTVTFNLHCIQHSRAFVDASTLKKRRQSVLDQLGGFSQQGAVYNVLEAFQRARTRMQEARQSLPRDLINTTNQLNTDSTA